MTQKKSTPKKSNGKEKATVPHDTTSTNQTTLTEDILQLILVELKDHIVNNDLQGISKNIVLYEGLLEEDAVFNTSIMDANISPSGRKAWDKLIVQAKAAHRQWLKNIKLNDSFEIFNDGENKWFPAKVITNPENDVVTIHYNGWPSKYDTVISLFEKRIVPSDTFCGSKKKPKHAFSIPEAKVEIPVAPETVPSPSNAVVVEGSSSSSSTVNGESAVGLSRSGRTLRKVQDTKPAERAKKGGSGTKKGKQKKEKDYNDWVCTICTMLEAPQGTELMLCDGPCRRSFHLECLLDDSAAQVDSWLCSDCIEGAHSCFVCNQRGLDYVEVNKCSTHFCGKFYHKHCIEGDNLPFLAPQVTETKVELSSDSLLCQKLLQLKSFANKITQKPSDDSVYRVQTFSFKCPLHCCDTCFVQYGAVDTDDLCPCSYCPRSFHTNCIPPGSRFNSTCLVCPHHPSMVLPGQALPKHLMAPQTDDDDKTKDYSNSVVRFFDQLAIPDIQPDSEELYDNHYRLQLYLKEEVESTPLNFKLITKNNYEKLPADKMPALIIPDSGCECCEEDHCGNNCYNRLLRVECCEIKTSGRDDVVCRIGFRHCYNRALQKKDYVRTKVFKEFNMGLGLKALEFVPSGRLVIEYMGEIIDEDEMQRRLTNQRTMTPNDKDYYVMELATGIYVDGKFEGNVSRYINHSCDPNCELQRWNVRGKIRIGIFAIRDIQPGEALSYDYQFDTQEEDVFKCYCGTSKCRGTMAPNKKDRLAKLMADNKLTKDMRQKLIQAGMNKEKRVTEASKIEDEWSRSYTGRCIPGDEIHEMKLGPVQNTFSFARYNRIFLIRNVLKSTDFLNRKKLLDAKIAKKLNGGNVSKKKAIIETPTGPSTPGRGRKGKRSRDSISEQETGSSEAAATSSTIAGDYTENEEYQNATMPLNDTSK